MPSERWKNCNPWLWQISLNHEGKFASNNYNYVLKVAVVIKVCFVIFTFFVCFFGKVQPAFFCCLLSRLFKISLHHLTPCLIHTDWTQCLLLRRTSCPRISQTAGGIADMPPELAGTLRLFHQNLPVCCVQAFVCDSLLWSECTMALFWKGLVVCVWMEPLSAHSGVRYLRYLLSDRWYTNTPLSMLGLSEEPAVIILRSKSPTVQDFTDV